MKIFFDHEKLKVYQEALRFYSWSEPILERLPKSADVRNQLDRARTSVALNIPEGNGKFTPPDRCRFFDTSRGSALESAGCLDLIFIKKIISEQEMEEGKTVLHAIVSMLIGLIRSNSPERLHEEPMEYHVGD
jgi:four helix bundle protein